MSQKKVMEEIAAAAPLAVRTLRMAAEAGDVAASKALLHIYFDIHTGSPVAPRELEQQRLDRIRRFNDALTPEQKKLLYGIQDGD